MRVRFFVEGLCWGLAFALPTVATLDRDETPVEPPTCDLTAAAVYRVDASRLLLEIVVRGELDPEAIRIFFFDVTSFEASPHENALWMVERGILYRRAADVAGWAWNEVGPVLTVHAGSKMVVLLPEFAERPRSYAVETYGPDGIALDRIPNQGAADCALEQLPDWAPVATSAMADLRPIFKDAPVSLSMRYETELKATIWSRSDEIESPRWLITNNVSLPVRLAARYVGDGSWSDAVFTSYWSAASDKRWDGTVCDMGCTLRARHDERFALQLEALLHSSSERAVELRLGVLLPPADWTWHCDYVARVPITNNSRAIYQHVTCSPFGRAQCRSWFPFGVVTCPTQAICVANHPEEPRHFRVIAEPCGDSIFFGMIYDLAFTPATSNFPGRATVACRFEKLDPRSDSPFMAAAQRWHLTSRAPKAPADSRILTADAAEAPRVPARYEMCGSFSAPNRDFQDWLGLCSVLPDRAGEGATATLSGGILDAGGFFAPAKDQTMIPGCLAFDWGLDPDLAAQPLYPATPAMTVWRDIERQIRLPETKGVIITLPDSFTANYDPRAMGVADFPCSYEVAPGRAALMNGTATFEFLRQIARRVRGLGKWIAVEAYTSLDPYAIECADAVLLNAKTAQGGIDRDGLRAMRVLAGERPVFVAPPVFTSARELGEPWAEYCFWGFLPIATHDDEIEAYMPLIERIAQVGWNGAQSRAISKGVEIHAFGRAEQTQYFVVRNAVRNRVEASLTVPARAWLVNPFTGEARMGPGKTAFTLLGDETQIWSIVPVAHWSAERQFAQSWRAPHTTRWLQNLDSLQREKELGALIEVIRPHPVARRGRNRIVLHVRNDGAQPITLTELRVIGKVFWDVPGSLTIESGANASLDAFFDGEGVETDGWLEVRWRLESPGKATVEAVRHLALTLVSPITVWAETMKLVPVSSEELAARFTLQNNTDERQRVAARWSGDFPGGRRSVELPPRAEQNVEIVVRNRDLRSREAQYGELHITLTQGNLPLPVLKYEWSSSGN